MLKRAPKRIHEDFFGLTRISRDANFASHILRIRWREVTDGATNRMSSAYNNILICHPTPLDFTLSTTLSIKQANRYGDNTPLCRTVYQSSKTVKRQFKQQKLPLVYQSSHVYQDCTNSVPIVKNSQKTVKTAKITVAVPIVTYLLSVRRIHKIHRRFAAGIRPVVTQCYKNAITGTNPYY